MIDLAEAAATVLAIPAYAGAVATLIFTIGTWWLIVLHLHLRKRGLAEEARRLAAAVTDDAKLPHVVVQIPVFNEGAIVRRAVEAALRLDWPRDRLHVQVLDDSTDGTPEHSEAAAAVGREQGIDVTVVRRSSRDGFKAGALAHAMTLTPHGFFAILDVDYVPAPDFLRRCMGVLLADPALAFAQARFDYLNADANALTQTQAVLLDAHLGLEQATRCWADHPLPFNGTCGIWRRAAIEEAGGWRGDTLAEDLDLSYRAWRLGWRGTFLTTVEVPGELPETFGVWALQQRRWTKGFGQVALRVLPTLPLDPALRLRDRVAAVYHLANWWSAFIASCVVQLTIVSLIFDSDRLSTLGALVAGVVVLGYGTMLVSLRIANRFLRRDALPLGRFLLTFLRLNGHGLRLGWVNGGVLFEVMRRRGGAFERTPKTVGESGARH